MCNMKSKQKSTNASYPVSKAFTSVYALLVIQICLLYILTQQAKLSLIKTTQTFDFKLHCIELNTIQKVSDALYNYEEEDISYMQDGYYISLFYIDTTCEILIEKDGNIVLHSVLVYDDIDFYVKSYTYKG